MVEVSRKTTARISDNRLFIFLLCGLFTLAMIYNWIFPLGALLYTRGIDGNDCGQMVWNVWHANEAITHGQNPFFTNLVYYPVGANLGHHTLAAGFFPITFLVKLFTGGDPMYPLYAYRLIALISFILILFFSYLFLREIRMSRWASAAAAVGYSFSHFYMAHVMHINHLAGFFIPLTALVALKAFRAPGRNLIWLAVIAALGVYFTEFSLYIYIAFALFLFAMLVFATERRRLFDSLRQTGKANITIACLAFLLIAGPFVLNLLRDKAIKPPAAQSSIWSGNLAGFVIPDPARTPVYARLFPTLNARVTVGVGGFETFLGFALIAFALIAIFKVRDRYLGISAVLCGIFLLLSLGGTLKVFGAETNIPMPYSLLMRVPPFDSGRTPVRIIVMGLFFLMIVAAAGMSWFQNFVTRRKGAGWAHALMALVFVWTTAEVYQPIAKQKVFTPSPQLSRLAPGPVFELPLLAYDGYASLLQVFHHQPIATGYLARISPEQLEHATLLKHLTDRNPTFCEEIKKLGYRNIIISPNEYMEPHDPGGVTQLELEKCSLPVIDLRAQGSVLPNHPNLLIREGREEPIEYPLLASKTRLKFSSEEADKYLWYGWSGREIFSHWTDCGTAAVVFSVTDLMKSQGKVKLKIFGAPFIAPGRVDTQRVFIELNDRRIAEWTLNNPQPAEQVIEFPAGLFKDKNALVLRMPDAASPRSLGASEDWRMLGFNVQWIEIE